MASLKEAFKVRQLPESEEYIITIGNHLATEENLNPQKRLKCKSIKQTGIW